MFLTPQNSAGISSTRCHGALSRPSQHSDSPPSLWGPHSVTGTHLPKLLQICFRWRRDAKPKGVTEQEEGGRERERKEEKTRCNTSSRKREMNKGIRADDARYCAYRLRCLFVCLFIYLFHHTYSISSPPTLGSCFSLFDSHKHHSLPF